MSKSSDSSFRRPAFQLLHDDDFPTGRSFPLDHPKIQLMKSLIAKHAREYDLAAKMSEDREYEGRKMRSKHDITTVIVNVLMPPPGKGHFKKKRLNGIWGIDTTYNEKKLRLRISNAFGTYNKEQLKNAAQQRQVAPAEIQTSTEAVVTAPKQRVEVVLNAADSPRESQLEHMLAELQLQLVDLQDEATGYDSDDADMPSVGSSFRFDGGSAKSGIFSLGHSSVGSSSFRNYINHTLGENNNPNHDDDSFAGGNRQRLDSGMSRSRMSGVRMNTDDGSTSFCSKGGGGRDAKSTASTRSVCSGKFLSLYLRNGGNQPPKDVTTNTNRIHPTRSNNYGQSTASGGGASIDTGSVDRSVMSFGNMDLSIDSRDESHHSNMELTVASGSTMQSNTTDNSQGGGGMSRRRMNHAIKMMNATDLVVYLEQILDVEISHAEVVSKISGVIQAVRRHRLNTHVQQRVCQALAILFNESPAHQNTIAAVGGIDCILMALKTHPNSAKVQQSGCDAIGVLALGQFSNQTSLAAGGGILLVLKGMQLADSNVKRSGCQALGSLAWQHPHNQEAIFATGGVSFVVDAMELYPEDANVQGSGCFALGSLAGRLGHLTCIVKVLLKAMELHVEDEVVQLYGCFALESLTKRSVTEFAKVVGPHAIEPVVTALHRHPTNAMVQSSGQAVLACITLHSDFDKSLLVSANKCWNDSAPLSSDSKEYSN